MYSSISNISLFCFQNIQIPWPSHQSQFSRYCFYAGLSHICSVCCTKKSLNAKHPISGLKPTIHKPSSPRTPLSYSQKVCLQIDDIHRKFHTQEIPCRYVPSSNNFTNTQEKLHISVSRPIWNLQIRRKISLIS